MKGLGGIGSGWIAAAGCIIVIAVLAIIYAIQGGRREATRQDLLASRETLEKSAAQLSESVQSYKTRLSEVENENKELKDDLKEEKARISDLDNKLESLNREADYHGNILRECQRNRVLLQTRLATPKNKREINPQLKKYWPIIEKKAPGFIQHYRTFYPDFGLDSFISREFEPKLVGEGNDLSYGEHMDDMADYVEGYDNSYKIYNYRVWSSDKKRYIATCMADCDGDEQVRLLDLEANYRATIAPCGSPCRYTNLTWLDEDTFMFVNHYHSNTRTDLDVTGNMVVPQINIYRTSPEYIVSQIGEHVGPPVDYERFYGVEWDYNLMVSP